MKNKFVLLIVFSTLLISILGCSFYKSLKSSSDSPANNKSQTSNSDDKTVAEKTTDTTVPDEEKIGVPECDEVIDFFDEQAKSEDDDFVTKATREYFFNKIRESFKQSIEENKGDRTKMAKECRKYKDQLDKYKAEEDNKKNNK